MHCDACGHDRLVAFSCKGRGFCPSCGGKRMTRFAEHLVDRVLPVVPVRQWVLTVPHRLRYRMAYDHDVCRAVHRAFARSLQMSYRHRAAAAGILGGSSGAVTCIQRFGSALICRLQPILRRFGLQADEDHDTDPLATARRSRRC